MILKINKNTAISDIQTEFSTLFPFLKIEFFTRPHEAGGSTWSKYMIFNRAKTLGEIGRLQNNENTIEITPSMSVNDFEQKLQADYGLSVQVFRKSMGSWIATTESDTWSLEKQNDKGRLSAHTIPEMVYIARDRQED